MSEGNAKRIKERNKEERIERDVELRELKWVLSSKPGRRFLWRQLEKCSVFESTFSQHNGLMSFNEGKRSIGTELLLNINEADSAAFFSMMQENREHTKDDGITDTESESYSTADA